jgi:apolipoprotein N-acyltransferase
MPPPEGRIARALRYRELIAALAGAGTSFAFAPYGLHFLAWLGPAVLFLLWEFASPRDAARTGFWFGAALFGAGTWWIFTAVHDFGQAPVWLAAFLVAALLAIKGAYYAFAGYVLLRIAPDPSPARSLLLIPAGWTLMEWLRGWLFTGFPWLQLGYAQSDSPLAGLATLGGIHLVTFAVALVAGAVVVVFFQGGNGRIAAIALAAVAWAGGWLLDGHEWTRPAGKPVTVALVQGAIPQDEKWLAQNRAATLDKYRALNREALGARIIVWPESAIPVLAHEAAPYLASIRAESAARGSDVLLGILDFDMQSGEVRNGLLAMGAGGDGWYYKRRLVPFGEFFPVPKAVRSWMRLNSLPYYDMTPGEEYQAPLAAGGERLAATICYEDAYGADQIAALPSATLLVNVTNNAWFGDSSAPHQQLQMARFRALEAGRFLVRATSNGITAVIGPDGAVVDRLPQFQAGVLKSTVVPRTGLTPYARTGNWPILSFAFLMLVAFSIARLRARHRGD